MDLFCVAYIPSTTRADRIKIAVHAGVEERPPAPLDGPGEGAGAGTPTTDVGASELLGASAGAFFAGAGAGTGAGAAALPPLTTTSSFWPPWQCEPSPSTTLKQAK
jgi:hypothetical protein